MSQPLYPPARPLAIGEILDLAIQIFKATALKGIPYGICAVTFEQLPNIYDLGRGGVIRQPYGGDKPLWTTLLVVGTLLALTAWSALLLRQRGIIEHTSTTVGREIGETVRRLPAFVLATLLFFALVGGGFGLLAITPQSYHTLASVPIVVVSFYLAILLSCTWPAVLVGGKGPFAALAQSARLVWGNWGRVSAVFIVGAAAVMVLAILVAILIALVVPTLVSDIPVMMAVYRVLANAMAAVVAPFVGALLLAVFAELRVRREGLDLQQRIAGLAVE
jgi:hypothetical protein